jgi:hypothetical protein
MLPPGRRGSTGRALRDHDDERAREGAVTQSAMKAYA